MLPACALLRLHGVSSVLQLLVNAALTSCLTSSHGARVNTIPLPIIRGIPPNEVGVSMLRDDEHLGG